MIKLPRKNGINPATPRELLEKAKVIVDEAISSAKMTPTMLLPMRLAPTI